MKTLLVILTIFALNSYSQNSFNINKQKIEFKSDSTYNCFKQKLNDCFNDKDFNFTDFVIDNNYFLVSKVLTLGEPKLYVSSFGGTVVLRKSKLK
jgi:hypothetical protein